MTDSAPPWPKAGEARAHLGTVPTVEIIVITYNHEAYLGEAIDSILAQETSFPIHVTIVDDVSTDNTREVAGRYANADPDRVRLIVNPTNVFNNVALLEVLAESRAEYIAVLDGDDYWIDPLKLQKQVDFMNDHADCALSYHNAELVYQDGRPKQYRNPPSQPAFSNIHELFVRNFIANCSVLYKRAALEEIPDWYSGVEAGDWYMHLLAARHGRIAYLPEPMAAYRIHAGGMWTRRTPLEQWNCCVDILNHMREHFEPLYHSDIDRGMVNVCQYLARTHAVLGNAEAALATLENARGLQLETLDPPATLEEIAHREPSVNDNGVWLDLRCTAALATSFAMLGSHSLLTEFISSQRLATFVPLNLLDRLDVCALRLVDLRGSSNELSSKASP
jgi:hypothetical protein